MHTRLKADIEEAIYNVIIDHADSDHWNGYIHDGLVSQMANAAEQVFDAAMKSQEFAKEQD